MTASLSHPLTERTWSPYQQAVFDAVDSPGSHIVVEALAGSGKSTTIVQALSYTTEDERVLMCAFNKSIADALRPRVPRGVEVSTLHSLGLKCVTRSLGRLEIDKDLLRGVLRELIPDWTAREARTAVAKLIGLAKGCLVDSLRGLDVIADMYDIAMPDGWERDRLFRVALEVMRAQQRDPRRIDFDDMIWLPCVRDLPVPQYDWVFVDETQDLNAAQLELVVRAAGAKGRIVAVGDSRQSIYQFRGADPQAMPRMVERLQAQVLPLSITYRCPLAVVREAQRYVPNIEAAPGAPEGIVRDASLQELEGDAAPGDFVISRTNAPLLSLCWRWIRAGIKAEIKGRDIGAGLVTWIKGTRANTIEKLVACADSWHRAETKRLGELERDTTAVDDKYECILSLTEGCADVGAVVRKVERLFGEGEGGGILLMSTHRAKGLEAPRVWLLRDTYLKFKRTEEEVNLLYVGITRVQEELIYVHEQCTEEDES